MEPILLETPRLLIRSASPDDVPKRQRFYIKNLDFFTETGPSYPSSIGTLEYHQKENEREYFATYTKRAFAFFMYDKEDVNYSTIIGNFNFTNVVHGHFLSCYLGYKMDQDYLGQGLIGEGIQAGIDYLFNVVKLHRIEANIMPRNKASIRVAEKLNFQKEGFSPRYLKINGVWEDHERWSLLNDKIE